MIDHTLNQYTPDEVSPPGETLLETIEAFGMSQADLADRMGRPRKTINEIIKGKTAITPETALQLERVLGVPARFWLNREQHYREALARAAEHNELQTETAWLQEIPLAEMVSRNWLPRNADPVEQMRAALNFFGVASPHEWQKFWMAPAVAYRKTAAHVSTPGALAAWLRKGELDALRMVCDPFDGQKFRTVLTQIRSLTVEPPDQFIPQLFDLCAQAGVAVALVQELPGARVSGATRWLTPDKALLQLSLRYKTNDHFWFSFFHEAAHILLHGKRALFLENGDSDAQNSKQEAEANTFAADFLIHQESYEAFVQQHTPRFSKAAIVDFATAQGIAPGIVVGRLQHDDHLPPTHCNDLKQRFAWIDETQGFEEVIQQRNE